MPQASSQPLHIFQKDLRHLWPETLIVLALFAAFAWAAPSGWIVSQYAAMVALLALLLKILMPLSWLILISRLIHDEPLVGDRQFWTSRPYHWASLLAAKLLYLLVFLYLPFLLMQVYLLKHAGLYPSLAVPALMHNLLLLTVAIVIPLTAIAAVTATFARMLLFTIVAILYVLVLLALLAWVGWQRMQPPALQPILYSLLAVPPAIALVYQYATRRTANARTLLLMTPLVAFILLLLTPAAALIRHAYPVDTSPVAPKLGTLPEEYRPQSAPTGRLETIQNRVNVAFPFTVANAAANANYVVQGASVTLDRPGFHWVSPFFAATNQQLNSGSMIEAVILPIPLDIFNQIRTLPLDVHLSVAADRFQILPPSTWKSTPLPFAVPGHGLCAYTPDAPNQPPTCRYPLQLPELNFVSATVTPGSCSEPAGPPTTGGTALGGHGATLDFDPVVTVPLRLSTRTRDPRTTYQVCPGTPLNFIEAKDQGKARLELEQKNIVLDLYASRIPDPNQPTPRAVPQP